MNYFTKKKESDSVEYEKAKAIVREYERKKEISDEKALGQWIEDNIGKTFVYRNNSYGCSDDEHKKWDCFYQIIDKKNNTTAIVIEFQLIDPRNKIFEIKQSERYLHKWNLNEEQLDGMPRCSKKEFDKMKKRIMRMVS